MRPRNPARREARRVRDEPLPARSRAENAICDDMLWLSASSGSSSRARVPRPPAPDRAVPAARAHDRASSSSGRSSDRASPHGAGWPRRHASPSRTGTEPSPPTVCASATLAAMLERLRGGLSRLIRHVGRPGVAVEEARRVGVGDAGPRQRVVTDRGPSRGGSSRAPARRWPASSGCSDSAREDTGRTPPGLCVCRRRSSRRAAVTAASSICRAMARPSSACRPSRSFDIALVGFGPDLHLVAHANQLGRDTAASVRRRGPSLRGGSRRRARARSRRASSSSAGTPCSTSGR